MLNNSLALPIGTSLLDFRIEAILGQGGFGITYLALDTILNCHVAIKEYFPREFSVRDGSQQVRAAGSRDERDTFAWGLKRFIEEARLLALFNDPNIIGVSRFFEANGTAYLVMDYCTGEALDTIIKRDGFISQPRLNKILFPLLDSLEHIHKFGLLHRDIKPANIFIRADGSPVLLDFGSARQQISGHSRSTTSLATAGYSPIEQYAGNAVHGPWTDIYGLAATLYRVVTGERPPNSTGRVDHDNLAPLFGTSNSYGPRFLAAIDAGMAVRPEGRPQSIGQWRNMFLPEEEVKPVPIHKLITEPVTKKDRTTGISVVQNEIQNKKISPWTYAVVGICTVSLLFFILSSMDKSAPVSAIKIEPLPVNIPIPLPAPTGQNKLSPSVAPRVSKAASDKVAAEKAEAAKEPPLLELPTPAR